MAALLALALACALFLAGAVTPEERTDAWYASHIEQKPLRLEPSSPRLSRRLGQDDRFGLCECSWTERGHPGMEAPGATEFASLLNTLDQLGITSDAGAGLRARIELARVNLTRRYGAEGFVNFDRHLRQSGEKGFCVIDKVSGKSMYPLVDSQAKSAGTIDMVSMKPCDASPELRARDNNQEAFVGDAKKPARTTPKPGEADPGKVVKPDTADTADRAARGATPEPTDAPDGGGGADAVGADAGGADAGGAEPSAAPVAPAALNEGCVAVEHLGRHATQYSTPQLRAVLCGRGLCATPNHALLVRGAWTSMRRLCGGGGWRCTLETRWVNNMKIAAGTRLRFSDEVVITPYDDRFPRALPWAIQIAQDALALLRDAIALGAVSAAAVLAHAAALKIAGTRARARSGAPQQRVFEALRACRL